MNVFSLFRRKKQPVATAAQVRSFESPVFDWRNEPDCVPVPGVDCRWPLPRPCQSPSPVSCALYGCDMRGGELPDDDPLRQEAAQRMAAIAKELGQ